MRPHEELPLFILWSPFLHWIMDHTEKFPEHVRHSIAGCIDQYALAVFEGIVEARYLRRREEVLKRIDLLQRLREGSNRDPLIAVRLPATLRIMGGIQGARQDEYF